MEWVAWLIAGLALINSAIHAWTGRANNKKKETINGAVKGAVADATLLQRIEAIAEKIDEIKTDIDSYDYKQEKLLDRMARVEERVRHNEVRIKELSDQS